jgi:hypothetical protein
LFIKTQSGPVGARRAGFTSFYSSCPVCLPARTVILESPWSMAAPKCSPAQEQMGLQLVARGFFVWAMQDLIAKAATLLEALPYFQRFRSQTFVVKYGGFTDWGATEQSAKR